MENEIRKRSMKKRVIQIGSKESQRNGKLKCLPVRSFSEGGENGESHSRETGDLKPERKE